MKLKFQEYQTRKLVNVHKHVDGGWFWDKYSAHPYVGCRFGCEFCYCRGGRYLGRRDPATFDTHIRVKLNAADRLRRELARLDPDLLTCGDWQQPAEGRFRLSRRMLEVVRDLGFPLFIIERSPLVTRDLDLLKEINRQAWVGAVFSLSSLDPELKQAFEPRSPSVESRLRAMQELASAGLTVGTSLMPILPFIGDDEAHLEEVVKATRDHGGTFVLAAGLTMAGVQAERSLAAACKLDSALETEWRRLYRWRPGSKPGYAPPKAYSARLGRLVRELCHRHGLADRLPRYIPPGPLATNKRVAEKLFLAAYDLELAGRSPDQGGPGGAAAAPQRIWAYRKAAWTVEELDRPLDELYKKEGEAGLRALPGIGGSLAARIAGWLEAG